MPGSHHRFWAQDLCISAHLEARFEIDGRSSRPLRVCCQKTGDISKQKDKVEMEVKIQQKDTAWLQKSCMSKEPKNAEESYTSCSKAQSHL